MKPLSPTLFFLLLSFFSFAQYNQFDSDDSELYLLQSDSIIKSNRVKQRMTIEKQNYEDKEAMVMGVFYDRDGRIIRISHKPFTGGQVLNNYYEYGPDGRIIDIQDSLFKGKPNPGYKDFFNSKKEYEETIRAIPDLVTYSYDLNYLDNELKTISRYDADKNLVRKDSFTYNGLIRKREIFVNQECSYTSEKHFLSSKHYKMIPLQFEGGMTTSSYPTTFSYDYDINEKGMIIQQKDIEKGINSYKLIYDKAGLLKRAEGNFNTYIFEYVFYH